jgi:hypothetical protein
MASYSDFSFSKLLRHLDGDHDAIRRAPNAPTEAHMRTVLEGYVAALGHDAEFKTFSEMYLAIPRSGEDPVGTPPIVINGTGEDSLKSFAQLIDVPFKALKAEMTAPPTFSVGNKAAMSFRLWAEVDARRLMIDIIETMTFDAEGKVVEQYAYWGVENVTLLD